jgi:hypothetical protein
MGVFSGAEWSTSFFKERKGTSGGSEGCTRSDVRLQVMEGQYYTDYIDGIGRN